MQETIPDGPYRATKLWNDVISSLRNGIPRGRHRLKWRHYADSFVASHAVSWLHQWLVKNPNFASKVSREQAVRLLQKLHKAGVFIDARGLKNNSAQFEDNYRLFIFPPTQETDEPDSNLSRAPLASLSTHCNSSQTSNSPSKPNVVTAKPPRPPSKADTKCSSEPVSSSQSSPKPLTPDDLHAVCKTITLNRVKQLLGVADVKEVLNPDCIKGADIHHNIHHINRNGIVTNIPKEDQLPHWVVAAMKCLAKWPEESGDDVPKYPGFECDVFRVVQEYFASQGEPLIPTSLYQVFTSVLDEKDDDEEEEDDNDEEEVFVTAPSSPVSNLLHYQSAERLIIDMSVNPNHNVANRGHNATNLSHNGNHLRRSAPGYHNGRGEVRVVHDPVPVQRQQSLPDLPGACLETWFGLEDDEPQTVLVSDSLTTLQHLSSPVNACDVNKSRGRSFSVSYVGEGVVPENELRSHHGRSTTQPSTVPSNLSHKVSLPSLNHWERADTPKTLRPPPPYMPPPSYSSALNGVGMRRKLSQPECSSKSEAFRMERLSMGRRSLRLAMERKWSFIGSRSHSESNDVMKLNPPINKTTPTSSETEVEDKEQRVFRLLCLFISPARRRKLSLLLRFMNKIAHNARLVIDRNVNTRDLVVQTFTRHILLSSTQPTDDAAAQRVVFYLMLHYQQVLTVPQDLSSVIQQTASRIQAIEGGGPSVAYCTQVSVSEYHRQTLTASQQALHHLLLNLINNTRMSSTDKSRRLKQFHRSYPEIYACYFPNGDEAHKKVKPPLIRKPLQKLRGLRL